MYYDYVVIGAGSAGSIVASKLAAYDSGMSILLIEAGVPPDNAQMWTPSDWFEVLQKCPEIEWGYQSVPQPNLNNRVINLAQAKVLGGCALHNAMVYVRGSISDFNAWGKVAPGWSKKVKSQKLKVKSKNPVLKIRACNKDVFILRRYLESA